MRVAHLRPALLRPALRDERLPDLVQEQLDVLVGDALGVPPRRGDDVESGLRLDPEAGELEPGAAEARAALLVAAVAELAQQAELERSLEDLRIGAVAPHLRELVEVHLARLLLLERLAHRLREAEDLVGLAAGALDQALDRLRG